MEFFARHVEPIDISLGGLRIHSDEAHPIGSFLPLDIFFPNVPPVTLSARVMWATLLGKGAAARFEVGLAFVELTPYALQLLKRAIGSEGAVPVIGVSEGASARALAHSSVEFISDEPATELHPVTPALRIARRQPDIHSTLSETPVVLVNAEALRAAQLDSRAGFLVSLIDGATTVESLLDLSGMPEQETLALLDHLRSRGIVGLG
ncbi:MAG TPA: PilZ domain-containing protein, partial [Polyangiaceae bacterium]|nr:PilZ domain-containing protein [Polyangiaceae bacterium]